MRLGRGLAGIAVCACLEGVGCGAGTGTQPDDAAGGPTSGRLVTLGAMSHPRSNHTATLLANGEVLFTGGGSPEVATRSAEIFDPGTGRSRPTADLSVPRLSHTATLLPSGKVLIVGGLGAAARSAELYDPATGSYRPAGAPTEPRSDHAAILLESGEVLLVGGDVSGVGTSPTAGAELYDPDADRFVATGSLRLPRRPFGVVRLRDGRVLVAGGTTTGRQVVASAELYDPERGGFTPTGGLLTPRHKHAAALQPDGSVLILGGTTDASDATSLSSAELYDPASGRFRATSSSRARRYKLTALGLIDGSTLVVGGASELVEVYDGRIEQFLAVDGERPGLRFFPTATRLPDGSVLVAGGYSERGAQPTVWRFLP